MLYIMFVKFFVIGELEMESFEASPYCLIKDHNIVITDALYISAIYNNMNMIYRDRCGCEELIIC